MRGRHYREGSCALSDLVVLCGGSGEGCSELTALDAALCAAGAGDYNLFRVTSVVPPGAKIVRLEDVPRADLPSPGSLVPCVLAYVCSSETGATITAAISAGVGKDLACPGIVMEAAGTCSFDDAKSQASAAVSECLTRRGVEVWKIASVVKSHKVRRLGVACAVAIFLYRS